MSHKNFIYTLGKCRALPADGNKILMCEFHLTLKNK